MERLDLRSAELLSKGDNRSLLEEFIVGASHSGLQAPALGLAQIADKVAGSNLAGSVALLEQPK